MKILLVDDHALIRQGLRLAFQQTMGFKLTAEASSGIEALNLLATERFQVVVMDINLPDMNGLEVIRQMREQGDQTPVLVLSMHSEESLGLRAIRAGADGYMSKEAAPDEILQTLRRLAAGKKHFSPELMYRLLQKKAHEGAVPHDQLSDREYQVLCGLARGQSISGMAEALGLSPNTVSTYRARIIEKLGVETNADLTRYALLHQLID